MCKEVPPLSLVVSLPLSVYTSAPTTSIVQLKGCLDATRTLPQGKELTCYHCSVHVAQSRYTCTFVGWSVKIDRLNCPTERSSLTLFNHRCLPSSEVPRVFYVVKVFSDFSWAMYISEKKV